MIMDAWVVLFFFSSRRRHTRCSRDWSSDVCSSDLFERIGVGHCQGTAEGPFARHIELPPGSPSSPTAQAAPLTMIETIGKFKNRMRPFASSHYGQCGDRQDGGELITLALRIARIGHGTMKEIGRAS